MTGAERAQRRREKLKQNNKYDEHKTKQAAYMRRNRAKEKENEDNMSLKNAHAVIMQRRAATRERVRKHRENVKRQKDVPIDTQSQSSKLSDVVSAGYTSRQSLGKAVRKVTNALPASPRKKKAVLTHIVSNLTEVDKETLIDIFAKPKYTRRPVSATLEKEIRKYFERDDISRVSPNTKDVKEYECPETGEKLLLSTMTHFYDTLNFYHSSCL